MKSLGARLTLAVVAVVALALLAFSTILFSVIRASRLAQFDTRLRDQAHALANMIEERPAGASWELELSAFAHLDQSAEAGFYELWMDDGTVLARSASLGQRDLPREGNEALVLPNGRDGRRVVELMPPRQDEHGPAVPSGRRVTIVVARDTGDLARELSELLWLLISGGGVTLLVAAAASSVAVRRGLRPVDQLLQRIDTIDDQRLSDRLPVEGIPLELAPVVQKLNALLARLEESFARDRRFSADVSHELRTPIAGLQSILEVTASRERSPSEYREALTNSLAVVAQMTSLVEALLTLAKLEARPQQVTTPTLLRPLVESALLPHAQIARSRRLTVTNEVGPEVLLGADPAALHLVLGSLLSNAFEHASEGGNIWVGSDPARGIWLEVRNSGPQIPPAALPRVFERFFRADPSRTGTAAHHGLGLSVVRSACQAFGAEVSAHNRPEGCVTFTVSK